MKIKRKTKIKIKYYMLNASEMKEIPKPKPGEAIRIDTFEERFHEQAVNVRSPIHRDVLNVRREGYRTRRPVSIRYKQKRLLALCSKKMRDKQRLEDEGSSQMAKYLKGQLSGRYDNMP